MALRIEISSDFDEGRGWNESTRKMVADTMADLIGEDYAEITVTEHLDDNFDPRVEISWEIEDGRCNANSSPDGAATVHVSRVTGLPWRENLPSTGIGDDDDPWANVPYVAVDPTDDDTDDGNVF